MSNKPLCPFCGNEYGGVHGEVIWWGCGTRKHDRFGVEQSTQCRNLERDALKARIAQLEEAVGLAMKMRRDWLWMGDEGYIAAYEAFVEHNDGEWDKIAKAMGQAPGLIGTQGQ